MPFLRPTKTTQAPFNSENSKQLCIDFKLLPMLAPVLKSVFNVTARHYSRAKKSGKYSRRLARDEIRKLQKSLDKVQVGFESLSADAKYYLDKPTFIASKKKGRIFLLKADSKTPSPSFLATLSKQQRTLEVCLEDLNDKGRPAEEELLEVMIATHQMWQMLTKRDFSLQWTETCEPISEAAQWAVTIVRTIDPEIPLGKIRTAAHKCRDRSIEIKGLRNIPQFVRHYLQRTR